jgi:Formyl transferase
MIEEEDLKLIGIIGGLCVSSIALFLNFFSTVRSIKSQRINNYQEITKSHREIWKLSLDNEGKFNRVMESDVDLIKNPVTYAEKRFVQFILLHATSSFYFAKNSHILKIEKMAMDIEEFFSMPIPRQVWIESRKYYNRDFICFLEYGGKKNKVINFARYKLVGKKMLNTKKRWNVLLLSGFPEKISDKILSLGDNLICLNENAVTKQYVVENDIDIIICFGYGKILKREVVNYVTCINVHASYLPFNKGPNPNLWAWIDNTVKGASIHYIDEGIDTGDLIARSLIEYSETETLKTSFDKLVKECANLFNSTWPKIRAGNASRTPQESGGSTYTFESQKLLENLFEDEWINKPIDEFCNEARRILGRCH